ncbi:ABC transporter permease [Salinicoccus jeotgali]|uniref:Putative hemin transport system permease protein HrtB n=1 Tax=Salinicoccus jeotgali TaxID=381634 RepID=A0ABP7FAI4_9STAP
MKLALKELKFYKFKYIMVTAILFLLAFLVLFVSALAQGLARENISGIDALNSEYFVMEEDVENDLMRSGLSEDQINGVQETTSADPLQLSMQKIESGDSEISLLIAATDESKEPAVKEGRFPESQSELLLNEKLKAEGFSVGDDVTLTNEQTYEVSGFAEDIMFAHNSMAFVTPEAINDLESRTAALIISESSEAERQTIDDAPGVAVVSASELKNAVPSYQAEQQPLNLMIVFLFVISAIVLAAFFYVITIQKTSQFGILKAIGTSSRTLAVSILIQVILITLTGVVLSLITISLIGMVIPIDMPFYLNTNLMALVSVLFLVVAFIGAGLSLVRVIRIDPLEAISSE